LTKQDSLGTISWLRRMGLPAALPEGTPDGPTPLPSCAACPDRAAPLCALPQGAA